MDGTFQLTKIGLVLVTVIGIDNCGRGFPLFFALVRTESRDVLSSMLRDVSARTGM
jgi:hypothetical protein